MNGSGPARDVEAVEFTLPALEAAYRAGLSAGQVVREVYRRIEAARDPGIFISVLSLEKALERAEALGSFEPIAKPLWGVPFAIKDNIDLAGMPTTAGCPAYAYTPEDSAHAVDRLIAAGAIPIGKTNLDQFATGLVGVRTPYPVPRNALDARLVPGGSSSGSAVAVARGLVVFALGTDTAGSGRVPAALNGIVGLKPSVGLVSTRGVVPACRTLDCVSIFARTVSDSLTVLGAIAGHDAADPYSRKLASPSMTALPPAVRIGVPRRGDRRFFGDGAAEAAYESHLARLSRFATLVEFDMTPFYDTAKLLYEGPWVAERYAAIGDFMEASPDAVHPVTREVVGAAKRYSASDAFRAAYRLAWLRREAEAVWSTVDALCLPTIPTPYSLADVAADPLGANARLGVYTNFVNLLDLCALAIPGPPRPDGLPAGVTLIGQAACDDLLAAIGREFLGESRPASVQRDRVVVAVVGAHMSGLPLNGELRSLGAAFVRAAQTAPDYRLFALPGGPPRRPGLLRVRDGEGASIDLELWALPLAGFGALTAGAPVPLSIGSVRLRDGELCKGFLMEAAAAAGAEDVSRHGGWRAYLNSAS